MVDAPKRWDELVSMVAADLVSRGGSEDSVLIGDLSALSLKEMPFDEFISALESSQAEAEAATIQTRYLTPLRGGQQFAALIAGDGPPDAVIEDQKASASAQSIASGAYRVRDLNTEVRDPDGLISISSNEFTVTSDGWVEWSAPAYAVDRHQSRLYDVSGAAVVTYGTSEKTSSSLVTTISVGGGPVTAGDTFRIEHRVETTGLGGVTNGWNTQVYTRVKYWKTK